MVKAPVISPFWAEDYLQAALVELANSADSHFQGLANLPVYLEIFQHFPKATSAHS
jgi:hypothetical protein